LTNPLQELAREGQAVWLDYIRRDLLTDGELVRLIREDDLTGVTSNPAIFESAIGGSDLYDEEMRKLLSSDPSMSAVALYERLAVTDIRMAADALAEVYERTGGADGFVSLEVSPHLARDAAGTVAEARRFWSLVDRPNLMIKVPATKEGIPAIEELLASGIHVNITLMFSLDHYEAVAQAYLRGLARAESPSGIGSVASFFVSRVDTAVDAALEQVGTPEALALRGRVAIANSELAYERYEELFHGEAFEALAQAGARPQRVLWASTSTKNPEYNELLYVEELIGPETVNTIPPKTLETFREKGKASRTLGRHPGGAHRCLDDLAGVGVSLDEITEALQVEGLAKFEQPFDKLLGTLAAKRDLLVGELA